MMRIWRCGLSAGLLPALSLLAGCGEPGEPGPAATVRPADAGATATAIAADGTARATAAATASPGDSGQAVSVESDDGFLQFAYSYPAAAAAIAPLKARFDAELAQTRAAMTAEGKAYKRDFPDSAATYGFEKAWKVVTDLPRFLSLSAEGYEYTGGAHGMPFVEGLLWDREAGAAIAPKQLFLSGAALDAAAQAQFCTELDRQRRAKRGGEGGDMGSFDECLKPSEMVVLLGSARGRAFDRIGIIALPYSAGPYAEGNYEVTLPVTPALLQAVKPEYRGSFAVR